MCGGDVLTGAEVAAAAAAAAAAIWRCHSRSFALRAILLSRRRCISHRSELMLPIVRISGAPRCEKGVFCSVVAAGCLRPCVRQCRVSNVMEVGKNRSKQRGKDERKRGISSKLG